MHPPARAPVGAPEHLEREGEEQRDPERGGRQRDRQQHRRGDVPAAILAVERQQRPDAGRERAEEADLERPQDVRPGGAEEQHRRRRGEREHVADAAPRIREQQHHDAAVEREAGDPVGHVGVDADRREERLEDEHRREREVLVVGQEQRVEIPRAAALDPVPLVEVERRAAPEVEQHRERHHEQPGEREPARPRGPRRRPLTGGGVAAAVGRSVATLMPAPPAPRARSPRSTPACPPAPSAGSAWAASRCARTAAGSPTRTAARRPAAPRRPARSPPRCRSARGTGRWSPAATGCPSTPPPTLTVAPSQPSGSASWASTRSQTSSTWIRSRTCLPVPP